VFDLARRQPLTEAVVAVDMALHQRLVDLAELRTYVAASPVCRGIAQARRVTELAQAASESPMESRLRLVLVQAGLPCPEVQVPLHDVDGRFIGRPDLYYPAHRLAIEFDGGPHRDTLVEDNRRQNRLLNAGCRLLRFTAADVYKAPDAILAQVRAALKG
jgi:very-short-patch-repair endonuclease